MGNLAIRGIVVVALATMALVPQAFAAPAGPTFRLVRPAAAVVGAALEVQGSGLGGRGVKVTVGGKAARVLESSPARLRFVVPKLRPGDHRLVVGRGSSSASSRLRVLRPFDGRVGVKVDRGLAKRGVVGPAGGTLAARGRDGTLYTLRVPAGALAQEQAIAVTPVRRFTGLPLTGGPARGAELTPEGLRFATAATLTIKAKRAFPKATLGFSYSKSGSGFEVQGLPRDRRTLQIRVEHFSSTAGAGTTPADFANAVQPLIRNLGALTQGQVETLLDLIDTWGNLFPPDFCGTQPVCGQAVQKALDSLDVRIKERCATGLQQASLDATREIIAMEALRSRLGAGGDSSQACRDDILRKAFAAAKAATCGRGANPLAARDLVADIAPLEGAGGDLDQDGELTQLEYILFLVGPLQSAGLNELATEALDCGHGALEGLPAAGRARCEADRAGAVRDLVRALAYAQALSLVVEPYVNALDFCRIELQVVPAAVTLASGEQSQFAVVPSGVRDIPNNTDVEWNASGGTIDPAGFYTAPAGAGIYEVTAKSAINPARKSTATVTVSEGTCSALGLTHSVLSRRSALVTTRVVQPGNVVIDEQADIDALNTGGITEITGNLTIGGSDAAPTSLTDLDGLETLETIGGGLSISFNPALTNVDGLGGLRNLNGQLTIALNEQLAEIDGLSGLAGPRDFITIILNPALTNVDGLCGTTTAAGLNMHGDDALTSLAGLGGLSAVSFNMELRLNGLTTLQDLAGLETAQRLELDGAKLTSVAGLSALRSVGGTLYVRGTFGTLSTYRLPALEEVGEIYVENPNTSMRTIELPALTKVEHPTQEEQGDIRVTSSPLSAIEAPLLTLIDGDLTLNYLSNSISANFAPGVRVETDVRVDHNIKGTSVTLDIAEVGRGVGIMDNAGLGGSLTFGQLGDPGEDGQDLFVFANDGLTMDLSVDQAGRDVVIGGCPSSLARGNTGISLSNFHVGSVDRELEVQGNVGFTDADATAWANAVTVGRRVVVGGNVDSGSPNC